MGRAVPAPSELASAIRTSVLVAGNAENFAVGESVRTAGRNRYLVVGFPTSIGIVVAARIPVKYFAASPGTVSATTSPTFAAAASALPSGTNNSVRKSHY